MGIGAYSNILFCRAAAALHCFTFILQNWAQDSPKGLWTDFVLPCLPSTDVGGAAGVSMDSKSSDSSQASLKSSLFCLPCRGHTCASPEISSGSSTNRLSSPLMNGSSRALILSSATLPTLKVLFWDIICTGLLSCCKNQKCEMMWCGSNFFLCSDKCTRPLKGQDSIFNHAAFGEDLCLHFCLTCCFALSDTGLVNLTVRHPVKSPSQWQQNSKYNNTHLARSFVCAPPPLSHWRALPECVLL